jgi:hypothetical protein
MGKVKLKMFKDSHVYGRRLETATFKILGKPPIVFAFTKDKEESKISK